MTIRVLLVDDHQMMRQGLRSILEHEPDLELVGEASSGREGVRLAAELQPEVVIMDVAMQDLNGIEATRQIKARAPDTAVVALSSHGDRRYVIAILEAGADGYVLKAGAYEDLRRAVRAVREGKRFLCPEAADAVVDATLLRATESGRATTSAFSMLAPREREVLQMIAEGRTSSGIAEQLNLAPSTIDTHRRNLMRKLGLHNIADLTRYAIREGLTSPDR
ncbi:MAG TPA: response regulator transcription factor [Planctomycetota bacterium]|nr:response regulator transcription factor [Planctomycetota bacterium]